MLQLLNAWMIRQFSTDSSTADAEDKFKAALGSRAPYLLPHCSCDFHPLPSLSVIIRNTTKMALLDFTVVLRGYSQLCTSAVQFTSQFDSVVELIRIDSLWYKIKVSIHSVVLVNFRKKIRRLVQNFGIRKTFSVTVLTLQQLLGQIARTPVNGWVYLSS